jgi:hypothetical protein
MKKALVILCSAVILSCVNDIMFETSQPEGVREEDAIPKKAIGVYRSTQDSSLLKVTSGEIIRYVSREFTVPRSALDSAYDLKADTIFYDTENRMNIELQGDSAYCHFESIDTIFNMSAKHILKKFSGHYFLNMQASEKYWNVGLMMYSKGELTLILHWTAEDLVELREITNGMDIVNQFRPTRRQIKRFLMRKSVSKGESFVKLETDESKFSWPSAKPVKISPPLF